MSGLERNVDPHCRDYCHSSRGGERERRASFAFREGPLWSDPFWSINAQVEYYTAQAFPDVVEAANKFLTEQVILEGKIAAELKAKKEAEAKAAALKKTTITCIKGKIVKKVTSVKPICPKGYKKK